MQKPIITHNTLKYGCYFSSWQSPDIYHSHLYHGDISLNPTNSDISRVHYIFSPLNLINKVCRSAGNGMLPSLHKAITRNFSDLLLHWWVLQICCNFCDTALKLMCNNRCLPLLVLTLMDKLWLRISMILISRFSVYLSMRKDFKYLCHLSTE